MISLTRPNHQELFVNSDLIETLEREHDTVITLVNGAKLRVEETPEEIIRRVTEFRREVQAARNTTEVAHG